ncbi:MAG TPA: hypothetical protein VKA84_23115, partial [Gemmatimonadaceae bacterium]|nr:hypothetical protein [Gemmatimonadaceae bacterium]
LPGLRVIGRMSASQYKGTTKSPQAIARELGATHLLTGTVRWERTPGGGRVRVSPQLMRAADQASVWNEPYEGPLDDVFRMQANVAERVAAALDVALRGVTTPPTQSLDAYDAYLRGLANAAQRYSPPALAAAVRAFERAVALDPNFAAAHARLALAFIDSRLLSADTAFIAKARASAERAVALDSTLADALFARAAVLRAEGDFDRAYRAVLAAARAAPSDPRVLYLLGELEEIQGHPDRAIATALRAMVLEPRSPYPPGYLASLYDRVHRHEEAIQVRERVFALSSEDPLGLGYLTQAGSYLLWRADTAGARRVLERGGPAVIRLLVRLPDGPAGRGIWRAVLPAAVLRADDTLSFDAFSGGRAVGMATVFQRPEMFYVMKLRHFVMMGRPDRARPYADSIVALLEPRRWEPDVRMLVGLFSRRAILAEAYAHLGRNADAAEETDRYLAEARQAREGGEEGGYTRALVNAAYIDVVAGRHDLAVARLEEALRGPSGAAISRALLRADPSWAPLRGHPGFARLLAGGS